MKKNCYGCSLLGTQAMNLIPFYIWTTTEDTLAVCVCVLVRVSVALGVCDTDRVVLRVTAENVQKTSYVTFIYCYKMLQKRYKLLHCYTFSGMRSTTRTRPNHLKNDSNIAKPVTDTINTMETSTYMQMQPTIKIFIMQRCNFKHVWDK